MPNTNHNLDKEIEEGLAQAEKMLRVEKNMSAISEINIDELPEIAQPTYNSLQESLKEENWAEVERLAQALKLLMPTSAKADKFNKQVQHKIKKTEGEENTLKKTEEYQNASKNRDLDLGKEENLGKQYPDVPEKKNPKGKLAWVFVAVFGILSLVMGVLYLNANNDADRYQRRYGDAKNTISDYENTLAAQEYLIGCGFR